MAHHSPAGVIELMSIADERSYAFTRALIGNGAQSEFRALAFHHLPGIEEFHLFDTDHAATE